MSSPMKQQANAVLNAVDEGKVLAILALIDAGAFSTTFSMAQFVGFCAIAEVKDIAYWIGHFDIGKRVGDPVGYAKELQEAKAT